MSSRAQQLTGPDRWQISYADLLTLLLGFFIVMYAVSSMEADEKDRMLTALQQGFTQTRDESEPPLPVWLGLDAHLFDIDVQGEWLYLTVAAKSFFASASAALTPQAHQALESVIPLIARTTGIVEIEGHTDNLPINTALHANNWALSSARAVAVVDYLINASPEIHGERFRAVGFGEFSPLADNTDAQGREKNRRVVIKIEQTEPLTPQYLFKAPVPNSNASASEPFDLHSDNTLAFNDILTDETAGLSVKDTLQLRLEDKGIVPQEKNDGGVKFSKD